MSHLKAFFPSWTDAVCQFNWDFWAKLTTQILHWNGFFPSWTDAICFFKFLSVANKEQHTSHLWHLSTKWSGETVSLFCGSWNLSSQVDDSFFIPIFSPCTKDICRSNACFLSNCKEHLQQNKSVNMILLISYEFCRNLKMIQKCLSTKVKEQELLDANKTIFKHKPS